MSKFFEIIQNDIGDTSGKICVKEVTNNTYTEGKQYVEVTTDGKTVSGAVTKISKNGKLEDDSEITESTGIKKTPSELVLDEVIRNITTNGNDTIAVKILKIVLESMPLMDVNNIGKVTDAFNDPESQHQEKVNIIKSIINEAKKAVSSVTNKSATADAAAAEAVKNVNSLDTTNSTLEDADVDTINKIQLGGFSMKSLTGKLFGSKKSKKRFLKRSFKKSKQSKRSGRKYRSTRRR